MDQHSREKIIIYSKSGGKIPKDRGHVFARHWTDVWYISLLFALAHLLSGDTSSPGVVFVSTARSEIEQIVTRFEGNNLCEAEDYNGNANVIHFAFNTLADVWRRLTGRDITRWYPYSYSDPAGWPGCKPAAAGDTEGGGSVLCQALADPALGLMCSRM